MALGSNPPSQLSLSVTVSLWCMGVMSGSVFEDVELVRASVAELEQEDPRHQEEPLWYGVGVVLDSMPRIQDEQYGWLKHKELLFVVNHVKCQIVCAMTN